MPNSTAMVTIITLVDKTLYFMLVIECLRSHELLPVAINHVGALVMASVTALTGTK